MESSWACAATAPTAAVAAVWCSMLEENNVPCVVLNQQDSSYLSFGAIQVMVPKDMLMKAKTLIAQIEEDDE